MSEQGYILRFKVSVSCRVGKGYSQSKLNHDFKKIYEVNSPIIHLDMYEIASNFVLK